MTFCLRLTNADMRMCILMHNKHKPGRRGMVEQAFTPSTWEIGSSKQTKKARKKRMIQSKWYKLQICRNNPLFTFSFITNIESLLQCWVSLTLSSSSTFKAETKASLGELTSIYSQWGRRPRQPGLEGAIVNKQNKKMTWGGEMAQLVRSFTE